MNSRYVFSTSSTLSFLTGKLVKKTIAAIAILGMAFPANAQFKEQRAALFEQTPIASTDVVMVGNSITNGNEWSEAFGGASVKNRGISGNTSQMVLSRLRPILKGKPRAICLLIGINDTDAASNTAKRIGQILDSCRLQSPDTRVFVQSVLPVNNTYNNFGQNQRGQAVADINRLLPEICTSKGATFIDIYSQFTTSATNKNLSTDYTNDGLHLLGNGYARWASLLESQLGLKASQGALEPAVNFLTGVHNYVNQRVSCFASLPGTSGTVLMLGDYRINTAEWSELLGSAKVLNRGIGGDAATTTVSIAHLEKIVPYAIKGTPAQVVVYAGTYDLFQERKQVKDALLRMENLITAIKAKTSAPILLQSILPNRDASKTATMKEYNSGLKALAGKIANVEYLDLFESFISDANILKINYAIDGNELNALGYLHWANMLAKSLKIDTNPLPEPAPAALPEPILVMRDIQCTGKSILQPADEVQQKLQTCDECAIVMEYTASKVTTAKQVLIGVSDPTEASRYCTVATIGGPKLSLLLTNNKGQEGWFTYQFPTDAKYLERHKVIFRMQRLTNNYTYIIDGVKEKTADSTDVYPYRSFGRLPGTGTLYIGGIKTATSDKLYPFEGTIHSVAIYPGRLTDDQLSTLQSQPTSILQNTITTNGECPQLNGSHLKLPQTYGSCQVIGYAYTGEMLWNIKKECGAEFDLTPLLKCGIIRVLAENGQTYSLKVQF